MLLEGTLVPQWIFCWSWSWLQRKVWVCCYKLRFHSWPTQRHEMKMQQLVCGHSLGEIRREQADRSRASIQSSHWVSESIANSTLDSVNHLRIFTLPSPVWGPFQPLSQTLTQRDLFYKTWQPLVCKNSIFTILLHKPTCNVKGTISLLAVDKWTSITLLFSGQTK